MKHVIPLQDSKKRSLEVRTKREISFVIAEKEANLEELSLAEYVVVINGPGTAQWIAKINRFVLSPGPYPKTITLSLDRVASLSEASFEVTEITQNNPLRHAKAALLDTEALFKAGTAISSDTPEPFVPLTFKDAATRLAWTYGVEANQVKISIQV